MECIPLKLQPLKSLVVPWSFRFFACGGALPGICNMATPPDYLIASQMELRDVSDHYPVIADSILSPDYSD
eukprot:CAMPEP_0194054418 /NCGR_PEP_ID=MMETSP0009_2-20130614/53323_1 /TAXON_ID=210454 /ORGANISM="Grammatophora oceanica, Strain CCMP 410" /LENGTH=70 /DNA_ID=CAMNT_0038702885 /DNA_START=42 /DNA_END=252 /DNA_ORIENTATION=-